MPFPMIAAALCAAALLADVRFTSCEGEAIGCPEKKHKANFRILEPTFANLSYGTHLRQKMDVWLPPSRNPGAKAPCVIVIHGGAWVDGCRRENAVGWVQRGKTKGLVVATISYRTIPDANKAGVKPPVQWPLEDALSAIRFVKAHAEEWGVDIGRIGLVGGSAGAYSSLYASLYAGNELGIRAIQASVPQTTIDPEEIASWVPGGFYGSHAFGYGYTNITAFASDRGKWLDWIKRISPAELLRNCPRERAPRIFMSSNPIPRYGAKETNPVHSGLYCARFKELCDSLGVRCDFGGADDFIAALCHDGTADPFDLIRRRIAAGDREISIPREIYTVTPPAGQTAYISLRGLSNATIDFNGGTVLGKVKTRMFDLHGCTNVTIRNLNIDYSPLPYTQAIIERVDSDRNWDVRIVPGYPCPTDAELKQKTWPVQAYDAKTLELKNPNRYRDGISITRTGRDTYRITGGIDRTGDIGDICIWSIHEPARAVLPTAVASEWCKDCRYENITAYSTPHGCGFAEIYCENDAYLKCRLVPCPPGRDTFPRAVRRIRSGNHDAFNSRFGAKGPLLDGCDFEYACDDCINLSGYFSVVTKCEGRRVRVLPAFGRGHLFAPGDTCQVMTFEGTTPPDVTVTAVEAAPDATQEERSLVMSYKMRPGIAEGVRKALVLTLAEPVAFSVGTVLISNRRMSSGFAIRNCHIGSTRARGMLIKASDGVIEGNFVEKSNYDGISLYPEYEWLEGGCARNVVIRNNKLRDNGGGIVVSGKSGAGKALPPEAHAGVKLENNDIVNRQRK